MGNDKDLDLTKIYKDSLVLLGAGILLLLAIFHNNTSMAFGLLLGGIASLLNFKLISIATDRLFREGAKIKLIYPAFYILRLFISGLVIAASIQLDSINLVTCIVGILWVRIVITIEALLRI